MGKKIYGKYNTAYCKETWMGVRRKSIIPILPKDIQENGKYENAHKTRKLAKCGRGQQEEMRIAIQENDKNGQGGENGEEQKMRRIRNNTFVKQRVTTV